MAPDEIILWDKIRNFELDDPGSSYTFSARLSRENGWTLEFSLRAIDEYKKFMLLICISNQPLTPSDQVDQVWHLHLLYTHSYWKEFCKETLQREIHHGPTRGGQSEASKFNDWYTQTLTLYKKVFQVAAPEDIWPLNANRFHDIDFKRINMRTHWIVKKPFV